MVDSSRVPFRFYPKEALAEAKRIQFEFDYSLTEGENDLLELSEDTKGEE